MTTQEYRSAQFNKINKPDTDTEYKTKIKFTRPMCYNSDGLYIPNCETNWMDIEESELQTIINILTK